jgi:ribose transport system ATP-binding protein
MEPLVKVQGISKTFGSTKALIDVSMEVKRGEVRGLIGENGSGKSTLVSMITGINKPDKGEMWFRGEVHKPSSLLDSRSKGINMLVQESGTINGLTVAENMCLGKEKGFSKGMMVSRGDMIKSAQAALDNLGISHIKASDLVEAYSFEDRKLMEVATALATHPELLIVDETTTALSQKGREQIYEIIRNSKNENRTVIFISHDLDELVLLCDSVTILRDGQYVDTLYGSDINVNTMRTLMVGRKLTDHYYREDQEESHADTVVLEAKNLSYGDKFKNVSFKLYKGEILGVCGLTDCGMHDLAKGLFGGIKLDEGEVVLPEKSVSVKNTTDAVKNGMAYLPKDRDRESMFLGASIQDNIVLPSLDYLKSGCLICKKKAARMATENADKLSVKMAGIKQLAKELSGGNKQKVVVAKWIARDSNVLIMDCPTRGIDIGVKAAIYDLMTELKKAGKSMIMISEEMPEVLGMADRVLIMKDGRLNGEFSRSEGLTEKKIIHQMI